jgi:hypothetical protein
MRTDAAESAAARGSTLDDELSRLLDAPAPSIDEFFDRFEQNLREAQVRLVFFLEEAPQQLKSLVDFLNRQMERTEVLIVEARQYEDSKGRVVVPSLFGFTEEARLVKKVVTVTDSADRRDLECGVISRCPRVARSRSRRERPRVARRRRARRWLVASGRGEVPDGECGHSGRESEGAVPRRGNG